LIVVDASVAVQWVAEEDTSAISETLLERDDLVAPELMVIEVANALRRKVFVGDMSLEHAKIGLRFVRDKVAIVDLSDAVLGRALELAQAIYHPVYDCIYLAVAELQGGKIVTYDQELVAGARKHGLGSLLAALPLEAAA
jgi:predicted nucleic acid-binding protein